MPSAKGPKSSLPSVYIQRKHSQAEPPPAYIANLNETTLYVDHKNINPISLHS